MKCLHISLSLLVLIFFANIITAFAQNVDWQKADQLTHEKASVIFNEIPYRTDRYNRVTYTLQLWQFDKEHLILDKIIIVDEESKKEIFVIDRYRKLGEDRDEDNTIPLLIMGELATNPFFEVPELTNNYITVQVPLELKGKYPTKLSHLLYLKNSQTGKIQIYKGANFTPRYNEKPLVIASPIKGKNLLLMNQSTMAYHVDALLMSVEGMGRGERFAFDYVRLDDDFLTYFSGSHVLNESFFCYGDTIYAVADGIVDHIVDGLPENKGDSKDIKFEKLIGAAGNYISQKLADGNYAWYAHAIPGSILVKKGDKIKKGQAIARVGNSGNSDCPHLHFQITKGNDMFQSEGIPFVFEEFSITGVVENPSVEAPIIVKESMMEQFSVIDYK